MKMCGHERNGVHAFEKVGAEKGPRARRKREQEEPAGWKCLLARSESGFLCSVRLCAVLEKVESVYGC